MNELIRSNNAAKLRFSVCKIAGFSEHDGPWHEFGNTLGKLSIGARSNHTPTAAAELDQAARAN